MEKIKRFFWWCSGATPNLLSKAPSEHNKYFGIGATVFFTGLFATLSGGYALYFVFNDVHPAIRLFAALLFGVVWGMMIFNLDRFIVSSTKKSGKAWKEVRLAIPRLLLAVMIALVIAKPLELQIFHTSIGYEMEVMKHQDIKKQEDALFTRFAGDFLAMETETTRLQSQIDSAAAKRDNLDQEARKEADGTGGSEHRGLAKIYALKKADADKAQKELDAISGQNLPLIADLKNQHSTLSLQVDSLRQNIHREAYDGFDKRLVALGTLAEENPAISIAGLFLMLLFLMIETAPVLVKLMAPRGPYDELLEAHEHAYVNFRIEKITKLDYDMQQRLANYGVRLEGYPHLSQPAGI
ncbi:MAG: DUF4407 domain-containing protein [Flavobacteriales bacterium]|nr:DUF4407 domain-containing protein [Flavobacteriales bacterium]MCB9447786.1 DUF4407 domain-containing protein [Flavobacteriales bacterium]